MLTSRNVELQFRPPNPDQEIQLGANVRREVFLIFKESLNNIAKHAGSTRVVIDVIFSEDLLLLRLEDNGRGFDKARANDGHGLSSMAERARGLGADFEIESSPRGTSVTLSVPLNHH